MEQSQELGKTEGWEEGKRHEKRPVSGIRRWVYAGIAALGVMSGSGCGSKDFPPSGGAVRVLTKEEVATHRARAAERVKKEKARLEAAKGEKGKQEDPAVKRERENTIKEMEEMPFP